MLAEFLDATNAPPSIQSAYRLFRSTETALLKVYSDLCMAMDRGHLSLFGLLDLSSAFHTVDFGSLLERLEKSYSIVCSTLNWLRCYLENRVQNVVTNQSRSSTLSSDLQCDSRIKDRSSARYFRPVCQGCNDHHTTAWIVNPLLCRRHTDLFLLQTGRRWYICSDFFRGKIRILCLDEIQQTQTK